VCYDAGFCKIISLQSTDKMSYSVCTSALFLLLVWCVSKDLAITLSCVNNKKLLNIKCMNYIYVL
jgi:hypothetical protein